MWDGQVLKLTFRRCVDSRFLDRWHHLLNVLSCFNPNDLADRSIWNIEASGVYSTRSFDNKINLGGVSTPIWDFWKLLLRIGM